MIGRYWFRPSRPTRPTVAPIESTAARKRVGSRWASGGDSRTYPSGRWSRPAGQNLEPY